MFEKGWGGLSYGYEACGSILCTSGKYKYCAFCLNLESYLKTELEVIRKTLCLLELINMLSYCSLFKCYIENHLMSKRPFTSNNVDKGNQCNQIQWETS